MTANSTSVDFIVVKEDHEENECKRKRIQNEKLGLVGWLVSGSDFFGDVLSDEVMTWKFLCKCQIT
jgi:hypothetical protein